MAKRFEEFIKEASDFHYFTGKNVAKGFLNQAPVQRTRAYDSDIYKDTVVGFLTDKDDNVRKEEEEDKLDINLSDEILSFDEFNENLVGYSKGHNPTNSTEFYHVTHKQHVNKIMREGIKPMDIKTYKELSYPNAVYFSESLIGAKQNLIDIAQYLKADIQDMVAIKFKLPKNAHIVEDRWMGNDSFYTPDEVKPVQILQVYDGQDFLKLKESINESQENHYQRLYNLSLDDIIKIRGLWSSFVPFHSMDEVEKAKVISINQKKFQAFKENNPDVNVEIVNSVLDWFTYGLDEDNEEELPKEDAPSSKELYDFFHSNEFKSKVGIEKFDL